MKDEIIVIGGATGGQSIVGLKNGKWTWTQSMTNELSMMLLTLAWLVRVDPSVHNIQVLNTVASKLLLHQQLNGGIKQFFGTGNEKNKCNACVPSSNQAYGDGEAHLKTANA